jgi:adenosine deaminase/aminodeoxyfutalosine deaminase
MAAEPRAELHLHLEGSVEPKTLLELGAECTEYRISNFAGFIAEFKRVVALLRGPDEYALIARRLFEKLERENIRYAEVTLSAGVILWNKQDFQPIYEAVTREAALSSVEVWWILDAIRHFGTAHAMDAAKLAVERAQDRVVAFGVGGDEKRGPAEWFQDVFAFTRAHGLACVPHAGETAGPESVWGALRLGADRIGHGIRAIDDPTLVEHLAERRIPLEVCISSNIATGAVETLESHPVRRLFQAGVPIVLNTDDPALFGTDLAREFDLASSLGFSDDDLREIASNGFRYALRPPGSCKLS